MVQKNQMFLSDICYGHPCDHLQACPTDITLPLRQIQDYDLMVTWSLAIALIKSISIPVFAFSTWKTNGAKMSHLKLHIDLGVADQQEKFGTHQLFDIYFTCPFLMILSAFHRFLMIEGLLIQRSTFRLTTFTPKAKPLTASRPY